MDFGILGYILNGGPHPRWYNCGTRSQEEWYATGNPRPILAVYLLGSGTVFATVYILALIAMIRGKMYNISPCYVVMIFMGFSDLQMLGLYIQAFIICSTHVGAAWGYLFMNYIPNFPKILSLVGEVAWQCSHGFPGMVYLILNKSIRKSVLKMLGLKKTIRWLFGYPDSYYNCSGRSVAEWAKTGERWPLFGAYFLVSGTAYMCLYLPTIYAMIRLNMIKDSCYKIMLTLIGVDILNIIANSIIAGYLFSAGAVFCTNPVFMYIEGAYNIFVWMAASFFYVLLAINRFIKVPMSIWLFLCLVYCTYGAILHTPLPYSSPHLSAHYIISVEDPVTTIRWLFGYPDSYYNCSGRSVAEWMETGEKWPIFGTYFLLSGAVYMCLYIPTIYAMLRLNMIKNSCYKIMFCLCIADMCNICWLFIFDWCRVLHESVVWLAASFFYVLLALNRFIVILGNNRIDRIFQCLYLPTIYAMIRLNLVKNSCYKIMFWLILGDMANFLANSLFAGYLFSIGAVFCMSPVFMYIEGAFNVFIWMVTACFYVLLGVNRLIVFLGNPRTLIQAVMITLPVLLGCLMCVYVQLTHASTIGWAIAAQLIWQTITGISSISYLVFNSNIRSFYFGNRKIASTYEESKARNPTNTIRWLFGYPDSSYNCSGRSVAEWMETGERWPLIGNYFQIAGAVYTCLYIPTIYAMIRLNLIKNSCYKIMFCLIIADMSNIVANSLIAGYMFSVGAVFCMSPVLMYLEGAYNIFVWLAASFFYVLLAVNRFIVILGNGKIDYTFQRIPTYVWVLMCLGYCTYGAILHKPLPYNSRLFGAYYVIGVQDVATEFPIYENVVHEYNNIVVAATITVLYALIALMLMLRRAEREKTSRAEMNALIQAFLITLPALGACILYVYMQMSNAGTIGWAIAAQLSWQTLSGISAVFYLLFNNSIRAFYFGKGKVSSIYEESKERRNTQPTA
ncbi:unnamed protein product, partial [Mesorhabditis spiculigera]